MKYDGEMLARLVAQAEAQPVAADMLMIRALIEEAGELGAGRALERLGLADRGAQDDVRELRELLGAWRDAKKAARGRSEEHTSALQSLMRISYAVLCLNKKK